MHCYLYLNFFKKKTKKLIVLCYSGYTKNDQNINTNIIEIISKFSRAIWLFLVFLVGLFFFFAWKDNKTDLEKCKVDNNLLPIFIPPQPKHSFCFAYNCQYFMWQQTWGIVEHHPCINSFNDHISPFYYCHFIDGETKAPNKVE